MVIDQTIDMGDDVRLNDLYWNSTRTVEEIVDELGVGRHTLYASIRPLPTSTVCTACGDALVFTNRTNRAAGAGTCLECGFESAVEGDRPEVASDGEGHREKQANGHLDRWRYDLDGVGPERVVLIGGAAALGVAFGAAAVKALRP